MVMEEELKCDNKRIVYPDAVLEQLEILDEDDVKIFKELVKDLNNINKFEFSHFKSNKIKNSSRILVGTMALLIVDTKTNYKLIEVKNI